MDRLARWHVPGLMFLGDSAHTMSPAGGIGLNLALRDSIVAANHLIAAVKEGQSMDAVFQRIEDERRPEVEAAQAAQTRVHRAVMAPMFVEHLMFTILGTVVKLKKLENRGVAVPAVEPRFAVSASPLS